MIREGWFSGRKSRTFTLQWHLTNVCRFHCAHCYDRTDRVTLSFEEARRIVADMRSFCSEQGVRPQFCLSGGDPLVYPHFWDLYAHLVELRMPVTILGNPISRQTIHRFSELSLPHHYQVSLEGLEAHNDRIRGKGHFAQCLEFLQEARVAGLRSHVMLTLSRDNLDQVLPLAEMLRGTVTRFTFNRLCQVGCGAQLALPSREQLESFLLEYRQAARANPALGCKDNFFNILQHRDDSAYFGGCTGLGCGAAFNFVALLPDGEVHACRKFPSLLGRLGEKSLSEIYHSATAQAYRRGPVECEACSLRDHCRGCMAVAYGKGLDPLKSRDSDCFLEGKSLLVGAAGAD